MANNPPPLPPAWRRLYAHILNLEIQCPNCGRMHGRTGNGLNPSYDRRTGIFSCGKRQEGHNAGCGYRGYVGVVLWPAKGRYAKPEDHVLTPGEAAGLRASLHAVTDQRVAGTRADGELSHRRRATVNLRCICGEACPVHPAGDGTTTNQDDDE